jgi:hypothetical protein
MRGTIPYYVKQLEVAKHASSGGATYLLGFFGVTAGTAVHQAFIGDTASAAATVAAAEPVLTKLRQSEPSGSATLALADSAQKITESWVALERDDLPATRRNATDAARELEAATVHGAPELQKFVWLHFAYLAEGQADYQLGDFVAAEHSLAKSLEAWKATGQQAVDDQRRLGLVSTWIAMAQARQGHLSAATQTIGPVLKFQRDLAAKNHGDRWLPQELAGTLYVQALAEPERRAALLREAAGLIDGLAPDVRATHDVRQWRERIQQAQQGKLTKRSARQAGRAV